MKHRTKVILHALQWVYYGATLALIVAALLVIFLPHRHTGDLTDKAPAWYVDITDVVKNSEGWDTTGITVCKRCGRIIAIDRRCPHAGVEMHTPPKMDGVLSRLPFQNYEIYMETHTLRGGEAVLFDQPNSKARDVIWQSKEAK